MSHFILNNIPDDEPMTLCHDFEENGAHASSLTQPSSTACFESNHSLGNDYCPHSSLLFPLMEADEELPVVSSSLRKQTAVTCLSSLVEPIDDVGGTTCGNQRSHSDFMTGPLRFGTLVAKVQQEQEEDEWGQFAHHTGEFSTSTSRYRLPSRRRPHQRRRSSAKFNRRGDSVPSNAWRTSC